MLTCRTKNEVKDQSNSTDILCKKSRNLIGSENFAVKTQEPDCQTN